MPAIGVVYLQGNPIVSTIKQYRKRMISEIKTLAYLDDRPVFELERRCAEAWATGGLEAERNVRKEMKAAEEAQNQRNYEYLNRIREEAKAKREALALEGKIAMADLGIDDDEEWEEDEEPPELKAARAKLAQYEARPGEEEPPELTRAREQASTSGAPETRPWQSLTGEEATDGGCGAGACDPGACASCDDGSKGRGDDQVELDSEAKENNPVEENVQPKAPAAPEASDNMCFGNSIISIKSDDMLEELD